MDSNSPELSLCLRSNKPKTIPNLLKDITMINNVSERLLVLNEYLHQHQEELFKIEGVEREFPLCKLFLEGAVETLKKEIKKINNGPKSESMLPMKERTSVSKRRYENEEQRESTEREHREISLQPHKCSSRCSSFMNYSQWYKEAARGFTYGGLNFQSEPLSQLILKNNRRSWTPELHARFVRVVEYLGGLEVATPKQIKLMMQVEGLTNDQVKSHLQKYRNNDRRAPRGNVDPAEY